MSWNELFSRPADVAFDEWFARIATALLTATRLVVAGEPHRLVEVEVYYHGPHHEDPFAHRDPVQVHLGRWYFHRTGGSFKGVDLAFGGAGVYSGVLFRGLEDAAGRFVDGPSLLVDHLLKKTHTNSMRELDAAIGERLAWDATSLLHLVASPPEAREVYRSARVGLTLKRERPGGEIFLAKEYRYLTEPRRTKKGKQRLVQALHRRGESVERIRELTGSPLASIRRQIAKPI